MGQSDVMKLSTSSCWALVLTILSFASAGCASNPHRAPAEAEGLPVSADADSFSIVELPDTQYYSQRLPSAYLSQTQWIVQHAREFNIQMVIGLGDIVDNGTVISQWHNAIAALGKLKEAKIPYFLAIGNHDYNPPFVSATPQARGAGNFNLFVGPGFYQGEPTYGGSMEPGSNENFYGTLKAGGRDYLVLILEFSPRDAALEWASQVVEAHPNHDVIVAMHSYLFTDNTRITECANYNKRTYGLSKDNDGEEVWSKFAIKYPNIRFILAGHIPEGGVGRRFDVGLHGNLVNEILSDYQNEPNAGDGWLRVMTVHPASNRVDVKTYSPYLASHPEMHASVYKTDSQNQFSLDYENPAQGKFESGVIHGTVRSGRAADACKGVAGALVKFPGGKATTDANGKFVARVSGPGVDPGKTYQAVEITVKKPGWLPVTHRATVRDGGANAELIFLESTPKPAK
jgi:hypothetical protein